jgi:hypothetical protein
MVQSGLVRCNTATLDGTCTDGEVFVETYDSLGYRCTSGYTFTNNTEYDATTYRTSATGTTFHGQINGASRDASGFGLTQSTRGYTWGEATSGPTCPSPSKGTFALWQRYDSATGWAYVTSSTIYRNASGMTNSPCWATVSSVSSTGGYYVD